MLGIDPTFVDQSRWAQFDLGPYRLALAGTDRAAEEMSLMLKVDDLKETQRKLSHQAGVDVGQVEAGPHEMRLVARTPYGVVVFYAPKPSS